MRHPLYGVIAALSSAKRFRLVSTILTLGRKGVGLRIHRPKEVGGGDGYDAIA
jgi:hypothetical protein